IIILLFNAPFLRLHLLMRFSFGKPITDGKLFLKKKIRRQKLSADFSQEFDIYSILAESVNAINKAEAN
ncbi:MAG: hypothetical protein M3521_04655, partial [Acidobacteriota bacterium]|nr:hypothetical protein [Acidobacteriota bacterium]